MHADRAVTAGHAPAPTSSTRESNQPSSGHAALVSKLVAYLKESGRQTWEDVKFKVFAAAEMINWATSTDIAPVHADVFSLRQTQDKAQANPCVYQVVVTRSDFLAAMAQRQQRAACELISEGFYFVAPDGIVSPQELPAPYGLVTADDTGLKVIKAPVFTKHLLQPLPPFVAAS
jgi:hypothetical protein